MASAGELPLITFSFVDVLEEFGLVHIFGLLVSKTTSAPSLLHLYTFTAVDVWREAQLKETSVFTT